MDRETAKQTIRSSWREIMPLIAEAAQQKVNGNQTFICPCGHGKHGDGIAVNPRSTDGNGLKCFGCGWSGDVIDFYQKDTGADFNTALHSLAQLIGIDIDPYKPEPTAGRTNSGNRYADIPRETKSAERGENRQSDAPADYTEYYNACRDRLNDPAAASYLAARGISLATAAAYWVGFDPEADPANNPGNTTGTNLHPCPRIIIPTTTEHYVGRSIDQATKPKYKKMNPNRSKGAGEVGIFNLSALYAQDVQEVFVTEGAFDALSIIEAGAAAIATNSASNAEMLARKLEERQPTATVVLAFDNDSAGQKARDIIAAACKRNNIKYLTADICAGYKDPNEALTGNREEFMQSVAAVTTKRPDNVSWYIDNLMGGEIASFSTPIKTGYSNLDDQTGGLYSGLYCIAAISSLGKTTFSAQMADQIAAAGNDVLFFSMEQSRLEMVSKSLARKTAQADRTTAVSSLSIRRGYIPSQVKAAAAQYKKEVQDRISIIEGNFRCNISFIGQYIREYIQRTGTKPVVFIDYLQILQPEQNQNGRQQTTREVVDSTVTELKRISREHGLTVFVISSVNRSNYLTPIDFESLKESGGIEYTCDVVWGLQLQCLNEEIFNNSGNDTKKKRERIKDAKAATPRKIELCCLKNRYGISSYSAYFDYFPQYDLFIPGKAETAEAAVPRSSIEKYRGRKPV